MPTTLTAQQYTKLLRDLRRIISEGQQEAQRAAALGLRLELNALPPKKPSTKASRTRRTKK